MAASKGLVTFFWYPEDREGWTLLISGLDSSRYSPEIRVSDVSAFDSFMANSRAVLVLHTRSAFRSRTRVAMKMQADEHMFINVAQRGLGVFEKEDYQLEIKLEFQAMRDP